MGKTGHAVLVAALFVAAVAVVPGGAVAADGLAVTGEQADDGTVTVTVTENSTAVANASVTVEALNGSAYAGAGSYETGENGTVELPAPEQNVSVDVTADANNTTATTTLDLVAPTDDTGDDLAVGVTQADDGSGTVSVTTNGTGVPNASVAVAAQDNVSYAGEGDYTADENGTVGLPAPEQNVTVDVTADADNQTATTTATLTVSENDSEAEDAFGARVSSFVHSLQMGGNMSGHAVAAFVTANNPGAENRSDNATAGPPEDKGNDKSNADSEDGDDSSADDEERGNDNGNHSDEEKGNSGNGNNGNGNGGGNGNDNGNGNNGNGNGPP